MEKSNKLREIIREMKREILIIHEENQPNAYIMPRAVYGAFCDKLFYLIDKIKDLEKSRDKWKKRATKK